MAGDHPAGGTVALLIQISRAGARICVDSVAPKHIIAAGDLADALSSSEPYRKTAPRIWLHGEVPPPSPLPLCGEGKEGGPRLDEAVLAFDGAPLSAAERPISLSRTGRCSSSHRAQTGLPKAANINHFRLMLAANAFAA